MNRINKAVEELFNQFMKTHFPGPVIVPVLAVKLLAEKLRCFFDDSPKCCSSISRIWCIQSQRTSSSPPPTTAHPPTPPKKNSGAVVFTHCLLLKNASNAPRNFILEICDGSLSLHVKQAHSPLVCYWWFRNRTLRNTTQRDGLRIFRLAQLTWHRWFALLCPLTQAWAKKFYSGRETSEKIVLS